MLRVTRLWKLAGIVLFTATLAVACQKESASVLSVQEAAGAKPTANPVTSSPSVLIEPIASTPGYCGSEVKQLQYEKTVGNNIGTVTVGNDVDYLYVTYTVSSSNSWSLTGVKGFVGSYANVPFNQPGNLPVGALPISATTSAGAKSYSYKVSLASLSSSISTEGCLYFILQASVTNGATSGNAWAVGTVISSNGAMGFNYCKQTCVQPEMTCGYSQGYWYKKPGVVWCDGSVTFGSLTVSQANAQALWVPRRSDLVKAFFQASAIQLSQKCFAANKVIPAAIAADYNYLTGVLSGVSYSDLQNGITPAGVNMTAVKTAADHLSTWICQNHCDATDTDACNTSL